jgi:hypothetical protein
MLTYGLVEEYKKLTHVTLHVYSSRDNLTRMPDSNFVIVIDWAAFFNNRNNI